MTIFDLLKSNPIVPVVILHDSTDAVPLATALIKGGIKVMEVTLRTPAALDAIEQIRQKVPEMVVGAGTIIEPIQLEYAKEAGARFAVSPGLTSLLAEKAHETAIPFLPAATTPSEIIQARSLGFQVLKFFPAESFGGVHTLNMLRTIFPGICFCPTGGVTMDNYRKYLELGNVLAVGGTWITPAALLTERNWPAITALAKQVAC